MRNLLIGLIVGLALGFSAGRFLPLSAQADPWIDAGLRWEALPSHAPSGPLPQTFAIPATAYLYGAASLPIGPLIKAEPSLLRIEAEATAGRVGVSLVSADGATLLSAERVLAPKDGPVAAYFRVTPQTPAAIVVLRNYDSQGVPGSVTVRRASYAPQSTLSAKALGEINRVGVD